MTRPLLPWIAGMTCLWASVADAQQVLEIDYSVGRTIFEDEFRAMSTTMVAVDWDRSLIYFDDAEEPFGIMAFSLETGEWIRTIRTPRGQGPYEFAQGHRSIAIGPGGGLYVAGFVRVVEYDPAGEPIHSWTPEVPVPRTVCGFGGAPAVPTQGGVVRRGPDGASVSVGPVRARGRSIAGESVDELTTVRERLRTATIACTEDRAYVLMSHAEGQPDSLFVYHGSGRAETLAVPVEDPTGRLACTIAEERRADGSLIRPEQPCPHWSRGAWLSFDDRGNLVLLGMDTGTHGAIIDPESGCYALIRAAREHRHMPINIRADSVLVFRRHAVVTREGNETFVSFRDIATGVSLHPLRRVSGEPCADVYQGGRADPRPPGTQTPQQEAWK